MLEIIDGSGNVIVVEHVTSTEQRNSFHNFNLSENIREHDANKGRHNSKIIEWPDGASIFRFKKR